MMSLVVFTYTNRGINLRSLNKSTHITFDTHRYHIVIPTKLLPKMSSENFVWAKLKGYSWWPAKICAIPPENISKPKNFHKQICVYFFGSHNQ